MNLVPSLIHIITDPPRQLVASLSADSHTGSRRNAMKASTALTRQRAELEDVEEYLEHLRPRSRRP